MPVDIPAVITEGNRVINSAREIVRIAEAVEGNRAGAVSTLTPTQIVEHRDAAIVQKGIFNAARAAFDASLTL